MDNKRKLIFIVLEGMGNTLLNKYVDKGYLQNLKKLYLNQGGSLISNKIPYETSAMQTAFTGYPPEEHGVFSCWKVHNYDYVPQTFKSSDLIRPSVWQLDEFRNKKFAVVNIFGTHPAYQINGYMLTYLFQQSLHACYPDNLIRELSKEGYAYGHDVSAFYRGEARHKFLEKVFKIEQLRVNAALKLLDDVDILIVNFTLIDRLSHYYWQEVEADSVVDEKDSALYKGYTFIDNSIGRFLNILNDNSDILIFSDYGFGPLREFVSVNNFLEQAGYLKRHQNGEVDWENTIAFESVQGSHGVNINLQGRYKHGCIAKDCYLTVRHDVISCLKSIINPKTGFFLFKSVVGGEEYYPGTYSVEAPDIMLEPSDYRYLPLGDNYWASHVLRQYQSGWHRREAFWTGIGRNLDGVKKDCSILDITPTIFSLSKVDVPNTMKGCPII